MGKRLMDDETVLRHIERLKGSGALDLAKVEEARTAMAEKMSALMTEDYLEALARQGDREAFDRVLAKVPSAPPDPIDTLYGCLKDLPRAPIADLEAEHQAEIEVDERWQRRGR